MPFDCMTAHRTFVNAKGLHSCHLCKMPDSTEVCNNMCNDSFAEDIVKCTRFVLMFHVFVSCL